MLCEIERMGARQLRDKVEAACGAAEVSGPAWCAAALGSARSELGFLICNFETVKEIDARRILTRARDVLADWHDRRARRTRIA